MSTPTVPHKPPPNPDGGGMDSPYAGRKGEPPKSQGPAPYDRNMGGGNDPDKCDDNKGDDKRCSPAPTNPAVAAQPTATPLPSFSVVAPHVTVVPPYPTAVSATTAVPTSAPTNPQPQQTASQAQTAPEAASTPVAGSAPNQAPQTQATAQTNVSLVPTRTPASEGSSPVPPRAPAATPLPPLRLPRTGSIGLGLLLAVGAALATSGAVVSRRRFVSGRWR